MCRLVGVCSCVVLVGVCIVVVCLQSVVPLVGSCVLLVGVYVAVFCVLTGCDTAGGVGN